MLDTVSKRHIPVGRICTLTNSNWRYEPVFALNGKRKARIRIYAFKEKQSLHTFLNKTDITPQIKLTKSIQLKAFKHSSQQPACRWQFVWRAWGRALLRTARRHSQQIGGVAASPRRTNAPRFIFIQETFQPNNSLWRQLCSANISTESDANLDHCTTIIDVYILYGAENKVQSDCIKCFLRWVCSWKFSVIGKEFSLLWTRVYCVQK